MTEQERLFGFCRELDAIFEVAKELPQEEYALFGAPDASPRMHHRGLMIELYGPSTVRECLPMQVAVALTRSLLDVLADLETPEGLQPDVREEVDLNLSCLDSVTNLKKLIAKEEWLR